MSRICLVTTGQPSTNPRLVKEADALSAAGYDVTVIGAHWASWADTVDGALLATRTWRCELVDWRPHTRPGLFWKSRLRHAIGRRVAASTKGRFGTTWAIHRVAPELTAVARRQGANLFIAHNLGALLPAIAAAGNRVPVGFDAEDFHSGQLSAQGNGSMRVLTEQVERLLLPRCAYVTAASPGIADAYARLCGIAAPRVIANVFPLGDRPSQRSAPVDTPFRLYWFSQTIGPDRGLEDAVRAMALHREVPTELHVRGTWQSGYEAALRNEARTLGLRESAIVHHHPAPSSEMVRLAAQHHVGLALEPPVSENNDLLWSNKVFTYLLAGLPMALSRTAGQARLAGELGGAAVTYPPGDSKALAAALTPWLTDAVARRRAGDEAWHLGATRYNWDLEQHQFLTTVREVLQPR